MKQKLSDQIRALEKQTPAVISKPSCQSTTTVGKLMASLGKAKREQVEGIKTVTPAEKERLATLSTELAADPARISRQLTALKTKLNGAITKLKELTDATSEKRVDELRRLFALQRDTQAAALLASSSLFAAEPLPNVGSETWRMLWEAARHFSEAEAYVEQAFPVTGPKARCVLCLQQLGDAGSERMTRFEAFVQDESKRREVDAKELYDRALLGLDTAVINEQDLQSIVSLLENDLSNVELGTVVRTYIAVESSRWSARLEMCRWIRETLDKESIWDEARSTSLSRW